MAAIFLLLLCITGIALNHSTSLELDSRYVGQGWLLDRYGIRSPDFGPSFLVNDRWITLTDGGLFLDAGRVELAGISRLIAAVPIGDEFAVAAPAELVMLNGAGEVVERSPIGQSLPAELDAMAPFDAALALSSGGSIFVYEPITASVRELPSSAAEPAWARPRELPAELREAIEIGFRGRGLTVERVLTDLHSGRLFGLGGAVFNDLTALALCVLAISGILIFFRR